MKKKKTVKKVIKYFVVGVIIIHFSLDIFDVISFHKKPSMENMIKITLRGYQPNWSPHITRIRRAGQSVMFIRIIVENHTTEVLSTDALRKNITKGLYEKGFFRTMVAANILIGPRYYGGIPGEKEYILPNTKEEITISPAVESGDSNFFWFSWWPGRNPDVSPGIFFIGTRCSNFPFFVKKGERIVRDPRLEGSVKSNALLMVTLPDRSLRSYLAFLLSPIAQLGDTFSYDLFRLVYAYWVHSGAFKPERLPACW